MIFFAPHGSLTSSSSPAISSTSVSLCLSLSSSLSLGESLLASPSSDSLPLSEASSSSSFAAAVDAATTSCYISIHKKNYLCKQSIFYIWHIESVRTNWAATGHVHFLPRCRWPAWFWPVLVWPSSWLIFSSWTWLSSLPLYSCSAILLFWIYSHLLASRTHKQNKVR